MNEKELFVYLTNLFETKYKMPNASAMELSGNLIAVYDTKELDRRIKTNTILDHKSLTKELQLYSEKLGNAGVYVKPLVADYNYTEEVLLSKVAKAKSQYEKIAPSQAQYDTDSKIKSYSDRANLNDEYSVGFKSGLSLKQTVKSPKDNSERIVERDLPELVIAVNASDYKIDSSQNSSNKKQSEPSSALNPSKQINKVTMQKKKLPLPKHTPQEKRDLKTLDQAKEAEQRLKEANTSMPKIDNVAQRFEYIDKAFYDKMPDETKARFSSAQVIKVDYVDMNGKKGIEEKVRVAVPINERVQVDELNVMDKDSTIVPYPQSYKDDYEVKRAKAEEDLKIRDQKRIEDSDEFIGPKEPEEYADGGNITVDMVKQAEKQKDSLFKSLAGLAAKAMKYKDGGGLKLNEVSKFNYSKYKS